ncbi:MULTISPECIES: amidase [unclassified Saccharopolyspora]|uniref:amidase n=1 Tax=Saccharopolyspora TaxID=1835 RepID=UPI00190B739A|nr:amidase [Saccharopolyspora sp. HNM0986]MBK0867711.1 amidase [Saccharopolyspora sp. HNM0986]
MQYSEYREHDGLGLAELIRSGVVPAEEVLEAAVARAEEVGPRLGALTQRLYDQARERVRGGSDGPAASGGPFAGVPFLLKDLYQEMAGMSSSAGSRALANVPAAETAEVVRRWTDAGLVVFGRTNTPEFGTSAVTEPAAFGPARNPWRLDRTPGGSSGGAAAAVAAGIVPLAGANDGGGSMRNPAACCGVFGFKAGRGVVPAGPARAEGFHGGLVDGVLSRTVRDSAAGLDCLTGFDPAGPFAAAAPDRSFTEQVTREPGTLRIGFNASAALGEPHPEAVRAMTDAAELLTSLGHQVEEVPPPVDFAEISVDFLRAWSVHLASEVEAASAHAPQSSFELETRLLAAVGRSTSAPQLLSALQNWHGHARRLARFHEHYDLLLTPSVASPPWRVGELETPRASRVLGKAVLALRAGGLVRRSGILDKLAQDSMSRVPYTQLANITGRPAMSVPLHWTPEGLPLGVQFVAPLAGESTLFQLAGQLERARPWAGHEPPLAPGDD